MAESLWIDDAIRFLEYPEGRDASELAQAAGPVIRELHHRGCELKRLRAVLRVDRRAPSRLRGFPLVEGESLGGPRHYLDGQPVHAGSPIYLLTFDGWMVGRYAWGFEPGTPGRFHFALPGSEGQLSIPIPSAARLAWSIDR